MVLNYIWIFFFAVAFIVALFRLVIGGDTEVFSAMMTSTFDMSKTGFEISLGLTGVLTLWMGIMKIGGGCAGDVRNDQSVFPPSFPWAASG